MNAAIGEICIITSPYFDIKTNQNSFKLRPALVISELRNNDYCVLPISRVTRRENLDAYFDVPIDKSNYPALNLNNDSFIRTHKQTTVHKAAITQIIANLKTEYPELFLTILLRFDEHHNDMINSALK